MKKSGRSNVIDGKFLGTAVQAIWERNERRMKMGKTSRVVKINGVLHIDGNVVLSDLEAILGEAVLSKLKLIYMGNQPLCHEQESKLVEKMLQSAEKLYKVKPITL